MASRAVQKRILEPSFTSSLSSICPSCRYASRTLSHSQRRHASQVIGKNERPVNSLLDKYRNQAPASLLKKKKAAPEPKNEGDKAKTTDVEKTTADDKPMDALARGAPSEDSVFGKVEDETKPDEGKAAEEGAVKLPKPVHDEIDPDALMNVLDPEPGKAMSWKRKKLIQQIRKRGVLTKAEMIKRTERECQVPSAMFKTSTKKLVHLARQIAGKPIEEAIVQMQLSKKRVAQDIRKHLEYARDMAVVSRGMGLGQAENRTGEPVEIELKDGKRKIVKDQTGIYVDQAWVNKGDETKTPDYRGRGRVFTHTHRMAKITVLLKEEATRIRLSQEREDKLNNRKLWLHLPDRPVTLQRQYPLW